MAAPIVRVRGLTKTFVSKERKKGLRKRRKAVHALRGVDLDVLEGEIFGLLGPNGAGKTTLIKCLTTLLIPDGGEAWVNGFDVRTEDAKVRASIGCMLMGDRGLYWKLTGRENLDYFGALYHVPRAVRRERIEGLIDLLDLGDFVDRTVETYSSGQKMVVAFAKALLHDPPILVLDEPTVTMDVPTARKLRRIVGDLNAEGKTILYTTHLMHEAEELCDRVAIIDRGAIIALGTPVGLKASVEREGVVNLAGILPGEVLDAIRGIEGVRGVTVKAEDAGRSEVAVLCEDSRRILPRLIATIVGNGAVVEDIRPEEVTLEDVFVAMTGRSLSVDTREVVAAPEGARRGRGP